MTRYLDVYFKNTKAGVLGQDTDGTLAFVYDTNYLQSGASAISFSMPLREEQCSDQVVRPFFSGLLPDEGARQRLAGALGLSSGNAFGLLEVIGGECAGALSLYRTGEAPASTRDTRLLAIVNGVITAAELGLREHDRPALARQMMERKLAGRRSSSNLPGLIELVMSRPAWSQRRLT